MTSDVKKFVRFCKSDFGRRVLEKEVEYVYRELKGCGKILDVGCGIGSFEQKLSGLDIVGLDNSKEMIEEANRRSNKTFVVGDAENLTFNDNSFDGIFYITSLEFINNYRRAIQEGWRVTKPNGKILVMVLNPESEYFAGRASRPDSYFRNIKHTNIKEIRDYIAQFYKITKEEYFLGIRDQQIFDTSVKKYTSLYVIVGKKK